MSPPPAAGTPAAAFRADGLLLAITALWGCTFVTVKDALGAADPLTFLTLRFVVGAVVAAAVVRGGLRDRAAWRGGLVLGGLLFVGFLFQTWGLASTTPSRSAFLTGLSVVLVPLVSVVLGQRRPGPATLLGAALAAGGLLVLTGSGSGEVRLGDVLTLGCTVAYAFHIALTERYAQTTRATALVAAQLAVTAALCLLALPFGPRRLESTPALWFGVAVTGVLASFVAISIQTWAQARTSAVRAGVIFALEPVFAAALSAALGRESLGRAELAGGALIVAGVVVSEVGAALLRRRAKGPQATEQGAPTR